MREPDSLYVTRRRHSSEETVGASAPGRCTMLHRMRAPLAKQVVAAAGARRAVSSQALQGVSLGLDFGTESCRAVRQRLPATRIE